MSSLATVFIIDDDADMPNAPQRLFNDCGVSFHTIQVCIRFKFAFALTRYGKRRGPPEFQSMTRREPQGHVSENAVTALQNITPSRSIGQISVEVLTLSDGLQSLSSDKESLDSIQLARIKRTGRLV